MLLLKIGLSERRSAVREVTAAIIVRDDKILIAQRGPAQKQAGKWEFPGGKIEPVETLQECLKREIREEFEVEIEVLDFFAESIYAYDTEKIRLLAYWCRWLAGDFILKEHSRIIWVASACLGLYDFAPADIPLVKKLLAGAKP
jgi:8-oxo-dGTP diphosphatase